MIANISAAPRRASAAFRQAANERRAENKQRFANFWLEQLFPELLCLSNPSCPALYNMQLPLFTLQHKCPKSN